MANVKRVVKHPKLYLSVGGKLEHVQAGTEITVSKEQAERLGGKVMALGEGKKVATDEPSKDGGSK